MAYWLIFQESTMSFKLPDYAWLIYYNVKKIICMMSVYFDMYDVTVIKIILMWTSKDDLFAMPVL